jgi:hypothetical protein
MLVINIQFFHDCTKFTENSALLGVLHMKCPSDIVNVLSEFIQVLACIQNVC